MTRIEFRSIAETELAEALAWYAARSNGTARRFLTRAEFILEQITEAPDLFPQVGLNLRRAPVGGFPYAIYYGRIASTVVVVGIVHGKRDPRTWRSRGW